MQQQEQEQQRRRLEEQEDEQRRATARALPPQELIAHRSISSGTGNGAAIDGNGNGNGAAVAEVNGRPVGSGAAAAAMNDKKKTGEESGLQMIGIENVEPLNGPAPSRISAAAAPTTNGHADLDAHQTLELVNRMNRAVEQGEIRAQTSDTPTAVVGYSKHQAGAEALASTRAPSGPAHEVALDGSSVQHVTPGSQSHAEVAQGVDGVSIVDGTVGNNGVTLGSAPFDPARYPVISMPMSPHLQVMCGPLLSYQNVIDGVWYGAALLVTYDPGSEYEPQPRLELENAQGSQVECARIYRYYGPQGSSSFFRFALAIPLTPNERSITYRINGGYPFRFLVPGLSQNMRFSAHSCNGFSSGVDQSVFTGPGFLSGYDPLWQDMLDHHAAQGLHCMVGGGDQIYCDPITREPELAEWVNEASSARKLAMPLTERIKFAVDRFYFGHYCKLFREGAFARANSTIPMLNMLDDHDLIDGFGSYEDETQRSPIFSHIGSRGYFWFLLFQLFTVDNLDLKQASHPLKHMLIGGRGAWIPHPNHSLLSYLGPKCQMLLLDCRAERKLQQICSEATYSRVFDAVDKLPPSVSHLVIQLGVPIAYPRMSIVENMLGSRFNPIVVLARLLPSHLGGFSNKFDHTPELLDDLNDHWCTKSHKRERNQFILRCQELALRRRLRISFVSGDVHCGAVAQLRTHHHRPPPHEDHRLMLNVVTSAIVNTPPPPAVQTLVNKFAAHKHRTLHRHHTDEIMLPLFELDTDGKPRGNKYVIGRRNYAIVEMDEEDDLHWDLMIEKQPGLGECVPFRVTAPAPRWTASASPLNGVKA